MQGFKSCAWREWEPEQKKSRPPKVRTHSLKNGERTPTTTPKSEAIPPPKSEHIELVPIPPDVPPDNATLLRDDSIREREIEQAGYWDGAKGELIKSAVKVKTRSAKVERVRVAVEAMQR